MVMSTILKKMMIGRAFTNIKGRVRLYGKMDWMLFPSRAFAINLQSIGEKMGKDYVYQLGYEAGKDAGLEILESTGMKPQSGWTAQKIVVALLDFIGFGKVDFVKFDVKKDGHHHAILHVYENPVIEHSIKLYGKNAMACQWFMGVYAAHGEVEMGVKNARLVENKCVKEGSPYCEWESKW